MGASNQSFFYKAEDLKETFRGDVFDPATGNMEEVTIPVYEPEQDLVKAVNLAIHLKRPLLLMGEPGCGKTRLAEAVAFEAYKKDYKKHYFEWYVKSTTKVREGIYFYDALRRLRMSQEGSLNQEIWEEEKAIMDELKEKGANTRQINKELENFYIKHGFIKKGPLANAFDASNELEKPSILLIDEIDKAEIDFPNDLLLELDKNKYYIAETDTYTEVKKELAPLIIITSNNEKELPSAFLRRCLFHYIKFPKEAILTTILKERFKEYEKSSNVAEGNLREKVIKAFTSIRDRLTLSLSEKNISTSELIDWYEVTLENLERKMVSEEEITKQLDRIIQKVKSEKVPIPDYQVLLKNLEALSTILPEEA